MNNIKPQIDHVVISVLNQLDEAKTQYEKLGFTITKRGHHSLGSSNHLAIFDSTYLELLGYEAKNTDKIETSWRFTNGLTGLAFKTTDAHHLYQSLVEHNVKVEGNDAIIFSRPVELADGSKPDAKFRIVRLDPNYTSNGLYFFCDHLTPELIWRPEWQNHPNGVTNVKRIVVEVQDPTKSITLLQNVFPGAKIIVIKGGLRFIAEDKFIDYLTPAETENQFAGLLTKPNNQQDRKVALTLLTQSLEQVQSILAHHQIHFIRQEKRLLVAAKDAFGVVIEFVVA